MALTAWTRITKEPTANTRCRRAKTTSPRSSCSRKKPFSIRTSGQRSDGPWAGVSGVISRSPVCMGRKRSAHIAATPGCFSCTALFRQLQRATPLTPSSKISPPPRRYRVGQRTDTRLKRNSYIAHCSFCLPKKRASTPSASARRRQCCRNSPKIWCRGGGWRGKGVGVRDVLHG